MLYIYTYVTIYFHVHGYVLWKCFASGSSSGSHFLFRKWDQTQACHVLNAEHEPLHECRCMWASRPQQQQHVQSHLQTIPRGLQEHFYCYKLKGWNHIRQEYICFLLETLPPSHWACIDARAHSIPDNFYERLPQYLQHMHSNNSTEVLGMVQAAPTSKSKWKMPETANSAMTWGLPRTRNSD